MLSLLELREIDNLAADKYIVLVYENFHRMGKMQADKCKIELLGIGAKMGLVILAIYMVKRYTTKVLFQLGCQKIFSFEMKNIKLHKRYAVFL